MITKQNQNNHSNKVDLSDTTEYLTVSPEDINLYFADTYLWFNDTSQWERITGSEAMIGGIYLYSRSLERRFTKTRKVEDVNVSFKFPDVGLYNFRKGVISFRRKTERQNKKALCPTTGELFNGLKLFGRFCSIPPVFEMSQMWKWNLENVNSLFGKGSDKFPDFEDAFLSIQRFRAFSRALSRQFFVAQGILSKHPSLWFRHSLIGRIISKQEIVVANPVFLQEAVDFFFPQGVSVDVEAKKIVA